MAELIVTTPDSKETVDLTEVPLLIGRHSENDLVYNDEQLSRRHCVIKREGNQFFIEDLDSKNGTYVNKKDTKRTVLNDGDLIEIGDVFIRFRQAPSEREQDDREPSATQADRIVPWINPFQSTSDSPAGGNGSFYVSTVVTGFLLLFLYGGYLLLQPVTPDANINNLLSQTGAWPDAPSGWSTNGASFGSADQFEHVLALHLSSEQNYSFVRHKRGLTVDSSSTYLLRARISTRQLNGLAGARITWVGLNGNELSDQLVLPVTEGNQNWVRHTSAPLHPPSGTKRMKLSFFTAGTRGTTRFHEPVLQKMSSTAATTGERERSQASFDSFPLHIDSSGQLFSRNTDDGKLLQSGIRLRRDDSVSFGWATSIMNRVKTKNTLHWTGTAFTPISFQPVYFSMQTSKTPKPNILYDLPLSVANDVDEIGFQFRYQSSDLPSNLGVLTSDGITNVQREQEQENALGIRLPMGNQTIIFQFSHPLTVQYRKVSNSFVINAFAPVETYTQDESNSGNRIDVGLTLMKRQPKNNQEKALSPSPSPDKIRELITSASYSKALDALKKLQPFKRFDKHGPAYQQLHEELQDQIQNKRSRIQQILDTARQLNSPLLLQNAREQLDQLRQKLGRHSERFQLAPLKNDLESVKKALTQHRAEPRERELYQRFLLFRDRGQTELAREFAQELVDRNAKTSYREDARAFLNQNSNSN